jgi:predicted nucleotidyltransferase
MQPLAEIQVIIRNHKAQPAEEIGVSQIGIFGSVLRGEARQESDIDRVSKRGSHPASARSSSRKSRTSEHREIRDYLVDMSDALQSSGEGSAGMTYQRFCHGKINHLCCNRVLREFRGGCEADSSRDQEPLPIRAWEDDDRDAGQAYQSRLRS